MSKIKKQPLEIPAPSNPALAPDDNNHSGMLWSSYTNFSMEETAKVIINLLAVNNCDSSIPGFFPGKIKLPHHRPGENADNNAKRFTYD